MLSNVDTVLLCTVFQEVCQPTKAKVWGVSFTVYNDVFAEQQATENPV